MSNDATGAATRPPAPLMVLVAHDMRQPLQAMMLNTHLLLDAKDEAVRQRARTLESQIAVLQQMLDVSSDLARLEAGLGTPDLQRCPVSRILEAAAQSIGRQASVDLSGAAPTISADARNSFSS